MATLAPSSDTANLQQNMSLDSKSKTIHELAKNGHGPAKGVTKPFNPNASFTPNGHLSAFDYYYGDKLHNVLGLMHRGGNVGFENVEVFKEKYVLLFISGLDRIQDEIRLLNSIYERLVEDPNDKSGFKKEEFKILWIPIENKWGDARRELFNTLKSDIKWYVVVEYAQVPLPGIRLIEEDLKFQGKPILPVVKPQGTLLNDDALDIIFEWGIHAFPFRKSDAYLLARKWKWFWDEVKKTNLHGIQVKGDRYIFIYGGSDKWTREFTAAVDKIKRHDTIRRADAIIDYYHLGKDDTKIVPRFWIGIEGKRQKKHSENLDCEIQGIIRSLLCLKQDTQGWAILSKGSNVRILGHGQPMYQTVADFEKWKERVLLKEGFDIAFQEYYDTQRDLPAPQPCEFNTLDVLATITCPNASCARLMEVTSVNYKCCHGGNVADHAFKSSSTTAINSARNLKA